MTIKQKKEAVEIVSKLIDAIYNPWDGTPNPGVNVYIDRLIELIDYKPRKVHKITEAVLEARRKGGRNSAKVRTETAYAKMRAKRWEK